MVFVNAVRLLLLSLCISAWSQGTLAAAIPGRRIESGNPSLDDTIYFHGDWRSSLLTCWTDPLCIRVLTTAHGGFWNLTFPYDSLPAFEKAYAYGADAVKGDFRVSLDNIGMVMHSSPILLYESLNCHGKYVEQMTAEECKACQMEFTSFHFISVPDLLLWSDEKIVVMLCVKLDSDIPRAISTLIELNATQRAFLEVSLEALTAIRDQKLFGWDSVFYVINLGSFEEFNQFMSSPADLQVRCFLVELNNWEDWGNERVAEAVNSSLALGLKAFAKSRDSYLGATVANHLHVFAQRIGVAYTYNLPNAVTARKIVNVKNGVYPP